MSLAACKTLAKAKGGSASPVAVESNLAASNKTQISIRLAAARHRQFRSNHAAFINNHQCPRGKRSRAGAEPPTSAAEAAKHLDDAFDALRPQAAENQTARQERPPEGRHDR